jgi:hypothetical protein
MTLDTTPRLPILMQKGSEMVYCAGVSLPGGRRGGIHASVAGKISRANTNRRKQLRNRSQRPPRPRWRDLSDIPIPRQHHHQRNFTVPDWKRRLTQHKSTRTTLHQYPSQPVQQSTFLAQHCSLQSQHPSRIQPRRERCLVICRLCLRGGRRRKRRGRRG